MTMKTNDIRSFMRSLPILASVLGKKLGVKVQIGGQACTDGKTIYLPPLPLNGGEELFILANGFLDHEAAHVRETNFGELQASGLSPLGHNLFNLAEDVRVERELAAVYPGCREHFKKMYRNMIQDVAPGDSRQAGKNIFCWLMNAVFHEQYPDVEFPVSAFRDAVNNQFPSLIPQLERFIQPGLACASTQESIAWGESVERFLLQYFNKSKPQKDDQTQPSSDGEPEAGDGSDGEESPSSQQSNGDSQADDEPQDSGTEHADAGQAGDADAERDDSPAPDSAEESEPQAHDEDAELADLDAGDGQTPQSASESELPEAADEPIADCGDMDTEDAPAEPEANSGSGDGHGDEPMGDTASEDGSEFEEQDSDSSAGDMFPLDSGDEEPGHPAQSDFSNGTGEDADDSEADTEADADCLSDGEHSGMDCTEAGGEPADDGDIGDGSEMDAPGIGSVPGQGGSDSNTSSEIGEGLSGSGESAADPSGAETAPFMGDSDVTSFDTGIDMLDHLIQGIAPDELEEDVRESLGAMVNSNGEMPQALGDILKQILEQISRETSSHGHLQVAVVKGDLPGEMPRPLIEQAQSATKVMATRLSGLLQTQTLTRSHTGRRGRIDGPRLHRLAVQNPRVFQRPAEKQSIDTAVHILLDCSSSMEECMSLANAACFSVASALHRIRGVNVGVTAFPGIWEDDEPGTVAPILKHGQRMHTRFNVDSFGSTPMGEAVWWTCQELMALKEERKIILLLTDGYPDSMPNAEAALEAARAMGIEIIGIGIGQYGEFILKLIENSRVINEIEELAPAMFGVLQQALTERGQQ